MPASEQVPRRSERSSLAFGSGGTPRRFRSSWPSSSAGKSERSSWPSSSGSKRKAPGTRHAPVLKTECCQRPFSLVLALHSHSLALFHSHSGTAAGFVVMSPGARPPPLCYAPVPEHKKREPFRFARPVPALSRPSWLAGVPGWRPSAAARFFARRSGSMRSQVTLAC